MRESRLTLYLLKTVSLTLIIAIVTWAALLVHCAYRLAQTPAVSEAAAQLGPLVLTHVERRPISGGYIATFSIEEGLAWYIGGWVASGVIIGLLVAQKRNGRGRTEL